MKKISVLLFGLGLLSLSSCNEFLDKLPDDRAEVNTFEKVTQLVSSAYATASPGFLMEWSSDNVTDNGKSRIKTRSIAGRKSTRTVMTTRGKCGDMPIMPSVMPIRH